MSESLELYWDRSDRLCVDFTGRRPMLRIAAEFEKGRKDRLHPMAPEFAEFLQRAPTEKRTGPVFDPLGYHGSRPRHDWVSKTATQVGKAAGLVVSIDQRTGREKHASVHDLRRSFGERWAARLLPQQLRELMRHESLDTTLRYYVGIDAERTADVLWTVISPK